MMMTSREEEIIESEVLVSAMTQVMMMLHIDAEEPKWEDMMIVMMITERRTIQMKMMMLSEEEVLRIHLDMIPWIQMVEERDHLMIHLIPMIAEDQD